MVYIGPFGMEYAHGKVHVLNPNNKWKRLHTLTYKWLETLTELNLQTKGESAGRKVFLPP